MMSFSSSLVKHKLVHSIHCCNRLEICIYRLVSSLLFFTKLLCHPSYCYEAKLVIVAAIHCENKNKKYSTRHKNRGFSVVFLPSPQPVAEDDQLSLSLVLLVSSC